ncbi:hypothetical protein N7456_009915 [Penicillium angulare]|uniref:Uncharacterized protein n=1 Tax=Penicillium angulare TaxID=116970 RepID=A0A9W9F5U1_9EURO|nr:hypothetical protein N7456_009915 [Penicillium angulare]
MSSFLQLSSRLRAPLSSIPLGRSSVNLNIQKSYVHGSPSYAQADQHKDDEDCKRENNPNHPIPSNNAHPTLRDGRQSNLSDIEGKPQEDLPQDVKKHNEEMKHRYDKPYNHIADDGPVEKAFEEKK